MNRRTFLADVGLGFTGLALGAMLHRDGFASQEQWSPPDGKPHHTPKAKSVIWVFLSGGVSQLETWDPKPNTDTGGPFRAIPTSVPGVHVSELLPYTAMQMHRLALVRGINTAEDEHNRGAQIMLTGRRPEPAMTYPHLGSVCAKLLGEDTNPLPGYIHVTPRGSGGVNAADAAFLGPRFASVSLDDSKAPANIDRPGDLTAEAEALRHEMRLKASERFLAKRRTAQTEAYTHSYDTVTLLDGQTLDHVDFIDFPTMGG